MLNFLDSVSENPPILNFMKISPVGVELFHADGRTEWEDEAKSRFSKFYEGA